MIKNNKFLIKKLDNIVVLGNSQRLKELIEINNSIGVKTLVITSSHQSKTIPKEITRRINEVSSRIWYKKIRGMDR